MRSHRFDALIVTALHEELEAVISLGEGGPEAWTLERDVDGFPFYHREFPREGGGALRIAAASFAGMGPGADAVRATVLIKELDPACLAMCGICTGKKSDVALGDVIIADRLYYYDHGKHLAWHNKDGHREEEFFHDIETYNLDDSWRVDAAYFARDESLTAELVKIRPLTLEAQERWLLRTLLAHEQEGAVAPDEHPARDMYCPAFGVLWDRLRQPEHDLLVQTRGVLALTDKGRGQAMELKRMYKNELPKDRNFKIHVGPIATSNKVQRDPELFERLKKIGHKILGAEMEVATLGLLGEQFGRRAIVVKAVSDYGDRDRDDSFRQFAARASAEVLLRFLLRQLKPLPQESFTEQNDASLFSFSRTNSPGGDDLLIRVQRVTELRLEASGARARIQLRKARAPLGGYLDVSTVEGPHVVNNFPVAAIDNVTSEVLEIFSTDVDLLYRRRDPAVRSTVVYNDEIPTADIRAKARARGIQLRSFIEYQGLIDFRDYLSRQVARLERDPIYPPSLYVDQQATFIFEKNSEFVTDDALGELSRLLDSPHGRFVLVLGDFGTGKTFLLQELARRMALERGAPVPVLIGMWNLDKALHLESLIAQHFLQAGMDRFDLPAFRYMLSEGRIALLFDGFDELVSRTSYERAAHHFEMLLQAAQGNAKVVVTSRTQHFLSDQQVQSELMRRASYLREVRLMKLQPFTKERILRFLSKQLGSHEVAQERFQLLDEVKDLLTMSSNPRMLRYIFDIPEKELRKAKERNKGVSAAILYEMILTQWMDNEFKRAHPKGAPAGLSIVQRWKAVTDLALRLWQRLEQSIRLEEELPEETVKALLELQKNEFETDMASHQIGSGTLLIRNEEGEFSFIHQSVMEWLVAKAVADELKQSGGTVLLGIREISPLMADFIWGLAGRETTEQWAREVLAQDAENTVKMNALLILKHLGVTASDGVNLAGRDLRGQDLVGRNLRNADLTGANLTGANLAGVNLVGANLTGAKLVRANLQWADLSNARLTRADLSDADMHGARLLGANAEGAILKGATLRQAKLIGSRFDSPALQGCDLIGAARSKDLPAVPKVLAMSFCYTISISSDGRTLATGRDDSICLWELDTGGEYRILRGHEGFVLSVAFSPDAKTLASCSVDNTIRLWDVASGSERRILKGHSQSVVSVAFSPDARTLASGSVDTTVRLWDATIGTERRVMHGHSQSVSCVAFSPDGKEIASGSSDTTVRLWDVASGRQRRVLSGHSQSVWSVAFSPDGQSLASGAFDATVRLWDVASGREPRVLAGHTHSVWCVAFSRDGKTLASGAEDTTVRLWDVATGEKRLVLKGHSQRVWSVAFSPDGKMLASASTDSTVRIWNIATGECLAVLASLPQGWVAFTPDGRFRSAGTLGGAFWHEVAQCRFEPGELDPYLPTPLRIPDDEPLYKSPD